MYVLILTYFIEGFMANREMQYGKITPAVEDGDGGSPCPEDGEFFDAKPVAAEIEEAISKFGVQELSRTMNAIRC